MSENILSEYLVKLGFKVDNTQYMRFESSVKGAAHVVESHTTGVVKSLLGWQGAITGAFVAIGGGILGMADKVAMADQQYRLFGLHMFMAQDQAKGLKISMDALGASLNDIAWDPELHSRFEVLMQDQEKMQKGLGAGFEYSMRSLRDLKFELQRTEVIGQYGMMGIVGDFLDGLFPQFSSSLGGLHGLNEKLIANLPAISQNVASKLKTAFQEFTGIAKDSIGTFKEFSISFGNVMGALTGDKSIQGTTFSWQKTTKGIQDALGAVNLFVHGMLDAEKTAAHLSSAIALLLSGNQKAAGVELKKAKGTTTRKALAVAGGSTGLVAGGIGGSVTGAELGSVAGPAGTVVGGVIGGTVGAAAGAGFFAWLGYHAKDYLHALSRGTGMGQDIQSSPARKAHLANSLAAKAAFLARGISYATGLPAELIWSQWAFETNGFTSNLTKFNNLGGIKNHDGKTNAHFASLQEFAKKYARIATHEPEIAGAKNASQWAAAMANGHYFTDMSPQSYAAGMSRFLPAYNPSNAGSVHIDNVNITVPEHITNKNDAKRFVAESMQESIHRQTQRNLVQVASGAHY